MQQTVSIEQVNRDGMIIIINGDRLQVSFDRFPLFRDMTLDEIYDVDFFDDEILEWEKADVHIYIDTFYHPEKYVQRFGVRPFASDPGPAGDLRELLGSDAWRGTEAGIPVVLGKDAAGKVKIADLSKAPHMLVAGSEKNAFFKTLTASLIYRFPPEELKLIPIGPEPAELKVCASLPHLLTPPIDSPAEAVSSLRRTFEELEHRYRILAEARAKNLPDFNRLMQKPERAADENGNPVPRKLPRLIVIVNELADVMESETKDEAEKLICRIAQKGRAAGIHLVIGVRTPSKEVISGIIKANLPTVIAFKVSTVEESCEILDCPGAEQLGEGDMLFRPPCGEMERIHAAAASDADIGKIADFIASQNR